MVKFSEKISLENFGANVLKCYQNVNEIHRTLQDEPAISSLRAGLLVWEQRQPRTGEPGENNKARKLFLAPFFSPALGCGSPTFARDTQSKRVSLLAG